MKKALVATVVAAAVVLGSAVTALPAQAATQPATHGVSRTMPTPIPPKKGDPGKAVNCYWWNWSVILQRCM